MRFNLPTSILDDIVYVIAEDRNTRTLWGGSRSGLSLLPDTSRADFFYNYSSWDGGNSISYSEVNSILQDQDNDMWLGLFGGGINRLDTRRRQFNLHRLEEVKCRLSTNSVMSLLQDDEGFVWVGTDAGLLRLQVGDHYSC